MRWELVRWIHYVEAVRDEIDCALSCSATPHELVELRALLAERVDTIDARLRELDGRNTAGAPALRREVESKR